MIDLRTLRPIDYDTVLESVRKTNRCVTVEEGFPVCSIGNHLSAYLMEHAFDYLDAPVINCTGKDVPMPYAANLEKFALITPAEIVTAEYLQRCQELGMSLEDIDAQFTAALVARVLDDDQAPSKSRTSYWG